jgi:hypothetical protein
MHEIIGINIVHHIYGPETADEEIWEIVVGGEKRGRVYGLGKWSRTSKKVTAEIQELQQSAPPPTRSTTTTTASQTILYSRDEVNQIVVEKLASQDKV